MKNKLRVLNVIPGDEKGAGMIFSKRQVNNIREKIDAEVFFLSSRTSLPKLFAESRRFRKLIKLFRPNIVHAHYGTITAFFCVVNTTLPLIITFHGSDLNKTAWDGFLYDKVGRFLSQVSSLKARMNICVSRQLQEKLVWSKKKSIVIPMGVDTDKFFPVDRNAARITLKWSLNEKVILFNGGYPPVKRNDLAVASSEIVKQSIPDVRLEILKGDVEPDLMPLYINASDCLLLCSNTEGSPVIIKEALACNLPIISTDVGDVKERLSNVKGTIIVKQNIHDIAEGLKTILNEYKSSEGREKIFYDGLSDEQVALRIVRVYNEILNKEYH